MSVLIKFWLQSQNVGGVGSVLRVLPEQMLTLGNIMRHMAEGGVRVAIDNSHDVFESDCAGDDGLMTGIPLIHLRSTTTGAASSVC